MNKQEYKFLAGLVRQGKLRPGVVGLTPSVAVGKSYSDFPPSLPSAVRRSWLKAQGCAWVPQTPYPVWSRMDARAQWMRGK